jgi:hypothetical protein
VLGLLFSSTKKEAKTLMPDGLLGTGHFDVFSLTLQL